MAYTQTDLDNLDLAILKGDLTVRVGDRQVTRRSIQELMTMRAHVATQLQAQTSPARTYPRFQVASFDDV